MKVFIYCRYPETGKVKTRLAAECGEKAALTVYLKLVNSVFTNINASGYSFEVHYTGGEKAAVERWLEGKPCRPQSEGDLGDRLKHSVNCWFEENDQPLVIIGSDQPDVGEAILKETEKGLKKNDVVLGPAKDGGYYLIAVNNNHPHLFENISWGTDKVFQQTLERIQEEGLSFYLLEEKVDIDCLADVPGEWIKELRLHEDSD